MNRAIHLTELMKEGLGVVTEGQHGVVVRKGKIKTPSVGMANGAEAGLVDVKHEGESSRSVSGFRFDNSYYI